jgi:hypothetical protein
MGGEDGINVHVMWPKQYYTRYAHVKYMPTEVSCIHLDRGVNHRQSRSTLSHLPMRRPIPLDVLML